LLIRASQGNVDKQRFCDADVIIQFHEDRPVKATCVKNDLFIFPDQRVSQDLKLVAKRKGRDRPDDTSCQRFGFFAQCHTDAFRVEMTFDRIQVHTAVTGHIGEAVDIFLPAHPHLHHHGLDRLLQPVPADLCNEFRATLGLVFDDAINRAFAIEKFNEKGMGIGHR